MEENKVVVDTEVLEVTPEELVNEVTINESSLSAGKIVLGVAIIGGIAITAVTLYKRHKKHKKAKQQVDEDLTDVYDEAPAYEVDEDYDPNGVREMAEEDLTEE